VSPTAIEDQPPGRRRTHAAPSPLPELKRRKAGQFQALHHDGRVTARELVERIAKHRHAPGIGREPDHRLARQPQAIDLDTTACHATMIPHRDHAPGHQDHDLRLEY
jgi:hypothetical protein